MKVMINSFDKELVFSDLEKAKNWMIPTEDAKEQILDIENFSGDDFSEYCDQYEEYILEIQSSNTLEELSGVWNRYSDVFGNGSIFEII